MNRIDVLPPWVLLPLIVAGVLFAWHGLRTLQRVWRQRDHGDAPFWLLRGGRGLIIALGCAALAASIIFSSRGLFWFGVVFLGEEIYETGMALLILRWGRKRTLLSQRCAAAG